MINNKLKQIRKSKGLTQDKLAEISGIHRNSIGNWERGKNLPKFEETKKIADALGVSIQDLIDDNTEIKNSENSENEDFTYWGGVINQTQKVINRGNEHEMSIVENLLKSAVEMFKPYNERKNNTNNFSVYSGENSNYQGNSFTMKGGI